MVCPYPNAPNIPRCTAYRAKGTPSLGRKRAAMKHGIAWTREVARQIAGAHPKFYAQPKDRAGNPDVLLTIVGAGVPIMTLECKNQNLTRSGIEAALEQARQDAQKLQGRPFYGVAVRSKPGLGHKAAERVVLPLDGFLGLCAMLLDWGVEE